MIHSRVVVKGDEACLDHEVEPGTFGTVVGEGYRPDVWVVNVGAGRKVQVQEDDFLKVSPSVTAEDGERTILVEATRMTSETGGQKDAKLARYDQIPTLPLKLLAERYGAGNAKYPTGPGEVDNWRKGYAWSLSYAALQRHLNAFWAGEDFDEETAQPHLIAAAWHCFALTEWLLNPEMKQFDDRQDPRSAAK